jgi:glutamine synthetase
MWVARYILERVAEIGGVEVNYEPKPVKGDWNGTGCHSNFSTAAMRAEGGYEAAILPAMDKLAVKHSEHIAAYGEGNEQRLTGKHETASIDTFKWGVADRGASIRVGNQTANEGKGYLEDRRPAGNGQCPRPFLLPSTCRAPHTALCPRPLTPLLPHPLSLSPSRSRPVRRVQDAGEDCVRH